MIERDSAPFSRATYANQARVHMGYHYPRSLSTAIKSAGYFRRFVDDFEFCILQKFDQVYAMSSKFSWTNAREFVKFCANAGIRCDAVSPDKFFEKGVCDGAFVTDEFTYDAAILRDYFVDALSKLKNAQILYSAEPTSIVEDGNVWHIESTRGVLEAPFLLNATYAGVNNVHGLIGVAPFKIKYELCEIILCDVGDLLRNVGITVMDGPFFSIMPFGKTGMHSLTSVAFTPHCTSYDEQPTFACQPFSEGSCRPTSLDNCNECALQPRTAWSYMNQLARKYLNDDYSFKYRQSLYSVKPILLASEVDDSRPTVIREVSDRPAMISVLSGKINTIYDLDSYLDGSE